MSASILDPAAPLVVGDVRVSAIVERAGPWRTPEVNFPDADPAALARVLELVPAFTYDRAANMLMITYQTFVLRTRTCTVLVDTCVGEHTRRMPHMLYDKTPWTAGFARHGLAFDAIDYVFCTHLHLDHVGWNTRLADGRLVPTFPRAKYVFSRREFEHWRDHADPGHRAVFEDCVAPIVAAGQALLVDDAYVLNDELALVPSPGHSPGHVCISLESRGEHALFAGDVMHHALQAIEPDWRTCFCWNREIGAASRRRLLADAARSGTLVIPAHFPAPTAGRIRPFGETWRFAFEGA
jgi:glyoxylase-like metal-dependent hydrolase (beta-lactamase superfamily II)